MKEGENILKGLFNKKVVNRCWIDYIGCRYVKSLNIYYDRQGGTYYYELRKKSFELIKIKDIKTFIRRWKV